MAVSKTIIPFSHLEQNVGLGEGLVGIALR